MNGLDINTPRGQETLQQERRAAELYVKGNPNAYYLATKKKEEPSFDAFIISRDEKEVIAIAETKCRHGTVDKLFNQWGGRWLVTYDKIASNVIIAKAAKVPLVGLLYLVEDDALLYLDLWSAAKGAASYWVEETRTQRTVNGGSIVRANAYIDMSKATIVRGSD